MGGGGEMIKGSQKVINNIYLGSTLYDRSRIDEHDLVNGAKLHHKISNQGR